MKETKILYSAQIWKEGRQYVAHTMPLDVMSSGTTPAKARAALDEAVRLFLAAAREMQTLHEVLEECGYRRTRAGWSASPQTTVSDIAAAVR